jgi:hypothetical protein
MPEGTKANEEVCTVMWQDIEPFLVSFPPETVYVSFISP